MALLYFKLMRRGKGEILHQAYITLRLLTTNCIVRQAFPTSHHACVFYGVEVEGHSTGSAELTQPRHLSLTKKCSALQGAHDHAW